MFFGPTDTAVVIRALDRLRQLAETLPPFDREYIRQTVERLLGLVESGADIDPVDASVLSGAVALHADRLTKAHAKHKLSRADRDHVLEDMARADTIIEMLRPLRGTVPAADFTGLAEGAD